MSLTDAEVTDTRRFCGYPVHGSSVVQSYGLYYNQSYGLLEFRIRSLSASELVVARRYLAALTNLELAVPRSADSLDTDQASAWTRNKEEPRDRLALLDEWRRRLCAFIGVPAGPGLMSSNIAIVV